jgi:hypothetical protein
LHEAGAARLTMEMVIAFWKAELQSKAEGAERRGRMLSKDSLKMFMADNNIPDPGNKFGIGLWATVKQWLRKSGAIG